MHGAEENDQPRGFLSGRPLADAPLAKPFESRHTHQNEQARDGGDVMRVKVWIKIRAEAESEQGKQHPDKPPLPERREKERQRQVERNQKEEAVKAHAGAEAAQVIFDAIGVIT